ncbi:HNH endonuclease [Cryobacterium cheniae]|uniref:HNH endonuclease n=1 Tax=Cryobacterium cheniae TaxID=1259262 RepID=A0A4R8XQH0_9MICO|nr:HNH endonuclease family protein [Cryobacterium cheniae]TFC81295.1 HNH endonuclease [Cryobacterium cheniae]
MPHSPRRPAASRSRRSRRPPVTALMVILALLALVWAAVGGLPGLTPGEASVPGPGGSAATATGDAADLLATLPVKGKAPKTGYDRTGEFGSAWRDVDDNGCDTRNDILARDLTGIVTDESCRVLSGELLAPYTGESVSFERGETTSMLVQIDHLVALSNAWQTGAAQLDRDARIALANDPLNLLASDGASNSQKGDGDAATWLPAEKTFRCEYVARQISVKAGYGLWVAPAEHDAMARVLATCPGQPAYATAAGID